MGHGFLGEEEDGDACEPLAATISVGNTVIQPELEPREPITADREGKATNRTRATKQTYLHNKKGMRREQTSVCSYTSFALLFVSI